MKEALNHIYEQTPVDSLVNQHSSADSLNSLSVSLAELYEPPSVPFTLRNCGMAGCCRFTGDTAIAGSGVLVKVLYTECLPPGSAGTIEGIRIRGMETC